MKFMKIQLIFNFHPICTFKIENCKYLLNNFFSLIFSKPISKYLKMPLTLLFTIQKNLKMMTQPELTNSTSLTQKTGIQPADLFIKNHQMNLDCPVSSTQFISEDNFACLGCDDGNIRVLSATNYSIPYILCHEDKSPISCLSGANEASGIKNSLMATHSQGTLEFWHATSKQVLFSKKYESFLQSCQVSPNGEWYCLGAENGQMFLGHLNKGEPKTLETGKIGSHNNRVFCLKWHPNDQNLFLSGGWDKTVFFWDVRTKVSVHKVFGSYIGGKAIDVKGDEVLLGNNQNSNHLRLYDIKADKIRLIRYQHYNENSIHCNTGINSCFFGKGSEEIVALTSRNQVRTYVDQNCVSVYEHPEMQVKGYSMSSGKRSRKLVASWNNGDIKIISY